MIAGQIFLKEGEVIVIKQYREESIQAFLPVRLAGYMTAFIVYVGAFIFLQRPYLLLHEYDVGDGKTDHRDGDQRNDMRYHDEEALQE